MILLALGRRVLYYKSLHKTVLFLEFTWITYGRLCNELGDFNANIYGH